MNCCLICSIKGHNNQLSVLYGWKYILLIHVFYCVQILNHHHCYISIELYHKMNNNKIELNYFTNCHDLCRRNYSSSGYIYNTYQMRTFTFTIYTLILRRLLKKVTYRCLTSVVHDKTLPFKILCSVSFPNSPYLRQIVFFVMKLLVAKSLQILLILLNPAHMAKNYMTMLLYMFY